MISANKSGKNGKKRASVVEKHRKALKGSGYEICADCAGCGGQLTKRGRMICSRIGGTPEAVTLEQAKACDGTRPPAVVDLEARGQYCDDHESWEVHI